MRLRLLLLLIVFFPNLADAAAKKIALLVGVNNYDKRGFNTLAYAERDVTELGKELTANGYEVTILTGSNKGDARATRAGFDTKLAKILKTVNKNDLLLVGFAGHGAQMPLFDKNGKPQRDSRGKNLEEAYYCPVDAVKGAPSTMISLTALMGQLDARGGVNLILVDACRNNPNPGRGRSLSGNELRGRLPKNTAILFACADEQEALETKLAGGGHGVFFHHVIEGLRGKAVDKKGRVTWNHLVAYVQEQVNSSAREWFPERTRSVARQQNTSPDDALVQTPHEIKNMVRVPILSGVTSRLSMGKHLPNEAFLAYIMRSELFDQRGSAGKRLQTFLPSEKPTFIRAAGHFSQITGFAGVQKPFRKGLPSIFSSMRQGLLVAAALETDPRWFLDGEGKIAEPERDSTLTSKQMSGKTVWLAAHRDGFGRKQSETAAYSIEPKLVGFGWKQLEIEGYLKAKKGASPVGKLLDGLSGKWQFAAALSLQGRGGLRFAIKQDLPGLLTVLFSFEKKSAAEIAKTLSMHLESATLRLDLAAARGGDVIVLELKALAGINPSGLKKVAAVLLERITTALEKDIAKARNRVDKEVRLAEEKLLKQYAQFFKSATISTKSDRVVIRITNVGLAELTRLIAADRTATERSMRREGKVLVKCRVLYKGRPLRGTRIALKKVWSTYHTTDRDGRFTAGHFKPGTYQPELLEKKDDVEFSKVEVRLGKTEYTIEVTPKKK